LAKIYIPKMPLFFSTLRQSSEKYSANHQKNIPPIIGKIFRQSSEKYSANRRRNIPPIVGKILN